ncbi:MAG: hypothetical protein ACI8VL_001257, partial [Bacteroidia bacterium]
GEAFLLKDLFNVWFHNILECLKTSTVLIG